MRLWNVVGPDIDAADAEPWGGPLAGAMRPFALRSLVRLAMSGALLYALSGLGAVALAATHWADLRNEALWTTFIALGFIIPAIIVGSGLALSPRAVRRLIPGMGVVVMLATPGLASIGVIGAGPQFSIVAAAYVQAPLFAFYMLTRTWAVLTTASVLGWFGLVTALQDGWSAGIWFWVVASITGTSVVVGLIAARSEELAAAEHDARVALAELNRTLEDQVTAQVGEIERLGGLRRFLSPQIADAILSGDVEQVGRPHRRRIAVFFSDLRGFTAFTNDAEPEEVIAVLDYYYRAVGGLLRQYDATVGDYAGDGVMAYFGDPLPRDDAAFAAVEMTQQVLTALAPTVAEWRRRGYNLDFGIGLAYGYATLGQIGFDGRYDYKPVGGVVNLAARLCAHASSGQVLLDHSMHAETSERFPSEHFADLDLKGYHAPIRAYALAQPPD